MSIEADRQRARSGAGRVLAAALTATVLALAGAACGSSNDTATGTAASGASSTASASTTTAAASGLAAEAKTALTELTQTSGRAFPKTPGAFNPGTGKLAIITCGNAGITCLLRAQEAQKAAKAMGWTAPTIFDGQFSPAKQSAYIQQAVQQGYDGILLIGIDTATTKAAIDAAAAADIAMSCVPCIGSDPKVVSDVTTGGEPDGEAVGTYVAAQLKGKGNVVVFEDTAFPVSINRAKGAIAALSKYCPACKVEKIPFPTSDVSKPGPPTFTAMLASHPKGTVDFVIAPYDAAAAPMAKTAAERGRSELRITGADGLTDFRNLIGSNPSAAATAQSAESYASWAAVDLIGRRKAGATLWDATRLPVVLTTADNVQSPDFDQKSGFWKPRDFDYEAAFAKDWGG